MGVRVTSLRDIIRPSSEDAARYRNALACAMLSFERGVACGLGDVALAGVFTDLAFVGWNSDEFHGQPRWAREMALGVRRALTNTWRADGIATSDAPTLKFVMVDGVPSVAWESDAFEDALLDTIEASRR